MTNLRNFISVVEHAWSDEAPAEPELVEIVEEGFDLASALADTVFKLRSHSEPLNESADGDYSLGFEEGCEMAAEMIENLIRQISGSN